MNTAVGILKKKRRDGGERRGLRNVQTARDRVRDEKTQKERETEKGERARATKARDKAREISPEHIFSYGINLIR